MDQGANYYYAAYADKKGKFKIENVRSGSYAFHAWSNGGSLANVSTSFTQNDVVVSKEKTSKLRELTWEVPSRPRIFQIGDLDRKTLGFTNGGAPYTHGLVANSPANLTYTIGKSKPSDWYYGSSALGSWTVLFDLPKVSNKTAVLAISLAGWSQSSDLLITVNGVQIATLITANLKSDPALYRSGTTAGEWRYYEFPVGSGVLKKGANNVVFKITRYTKWRGYLWDSVFLDWSS